MATTKRDVAAEITRLAQQRILVLDGAWGTMIHGAGLAPEDYGGDRFRGHPIDVAGDPDILNLTRPELVRSIHDALPRSRGRHHDDEHLHGDLDRPVRLRARGRCLRDERRRRAPRA